ncbi:MAG: FAD-binding domain-containing protein [Planctomycetota bacterium]
MNSTALVWFKKDLRVCDHQPLCKGAEHRRLICLYAYEPDIIQADDFDGSHLVFINESLAELDQALRQLGNRLTLQCGNCVAILEQLHARHNFEHIYSHEETGNAITYARDLKVRAWAKENDVQLHEYAQNGVVRRLANRDGWASKWNRKMSEPLHPAPSKLPPSPESRAGELLDENGLGIKPSERTVAQTGGRSSALELLQTFLEQRGENYRSDMSSPLGGSHSCSRLSPYLAFGCISVREVLQATRSQVEDIKSDPETNGRSNWLKSLSSFQSRLSWHCHFMQKLEDEPDIEFQNMNRGYDGLREEEFREDYFQAFCNAQTGYPMIDACMRALQQTGWINFRMRAMLVSFSSYHLWLHWPRPAAFMARLFLDYEPGIHYSQFQMQSGVTGINTVRIYSPIKQALDNDPNGDFIREYVPELAELPNELLAEPHKMTQMEQLLYGCQLGKDYPLPIVEHKEAYARAKQRIFEAKNRPETREFAARVYQKHGSRKTPARERR